MSEQELQDILATIARVREANTVTPEMAREFLQKEGVIDAQGNLTGPYARKKVEPAAA
ncbi:hypothetical protein [Pseudorhodoplanes sp.]|jgi:hypothetical protein|uniref:hypothetical protein n=1 Tax=Pseudorhodoplanes sp. TaxID=1934341 RepID=UPI002CAC7C3E|nr:hypothetical protein [Pseudorhodoplanes sp.]HWV42715.1 hypothetical protein [Pseudorhodoplanes sp.]